MSSCFRYRTLATLIAVVVNLSIGSLQLSAQEGDMQSEQQESQYTSDISNMKENLTLLHHISSIESLQEMADMMSIEDIEVVKDQLWRTDLRWSLFYADIEKRAADNDEMLDNIAKYNTIHQSITDTISYKEGYFMALGEFSDAQETMDERLEQYEQMQSSASEMELVESLADKLEELKAQEVLLMESTKSIYDQMKANSEKYVELEPLMEPLDKSFTQIMLLSDSIKKAEFKPLLDRIKEYLYSFAAVAIILMLINMIYTKIDTIIKLKKSAKAMLKLTNSSNNEYPKM